MMHIDDMDFENTAKALMILNPDTVMKHKSWQELVDFMIAMAETYGYKSNHFSTGGFVLTFYDGHNGRRHARASVSGFVALNHVQKSQFPSPY